MKLKFTLKNITGRMLSVQLKHAIQEEQTGWDNQSNATLEGNLWTTASGKSAYALLNPEDNSSGAIIEYEGEPSNFLAEKLIPGELRGETTSAVITESQALGVRELAHPNPLDPNALELVQIYRLLEQSSLDNDPTYCLRAIKAANLVQNRMKDAGMNTNGSWCVAAAIGENLTAHLVLHLGGRQVSLHTTLDKREFQVNYRAEVVAAEIVDWINKFINFIHFFTGQPKKLEAVNTQ
jgi:hypothetical protein